MIGEGVKRIHIIGGPGSGKTTLALRLASLLNIPFYELDVIGWEGGVGAPRPLEVILSDISCIAAQPAWVTEGPLLEGTDELLRAADAIVWLDLPWRIAGWRIVMRHIRTSLAGTNRHRGLIKLYRFLGSSREYYRSKDSMGSYTRAYTANYLAPYADKVVHCRCPAEVEAFFSRCISQWQEQKDEMPS